MIVLSCASIGIFCGLHSNDSINSSVAHLKLNTLIPSHGTCSGFGHVDRILCPPPSNCGAKGGGDCPPEGAYCSKSRRFTSYFLGFFLAEVDVTRNVSPGPPGVGFDGVDRVLVWLNVLGQGGSVRSKPRFYIISKSVFCLRSGDPDDRFFIFNNEEVSINFFDLRIVSQIEIKCLRML